MNLLHEKRLSFLLGRFLVEFSEDDGDDAVFLFTDDVEEFDVPVVVFALLALVFHVVGGTGFFDVVGGFVEDVGFFEHVFLGVGHFAFDFICDLSFFFVYFDL